MSRFVLDVRLLPCDVSLWGFFVTYPPVQPSLLPSSLTWILQLVKDGLVIRLPQVVHSRARVNLRHEAKK